ncbi:Uncharacterized protein GBIM_05293, partial [Gryllus bimaculatus]
MCCWRKNSWGVRVRAMLAHANTDYWRSGSGVRRAYRYGGCPPSGPATWRAAAGLAPGAAPARDGSSPATAPADGPAPAQPPPQQQNCPRSAAPATAPAPTGEGDAVAVPASGPPGEVGPQPPDGDGDSNATADVCDNSNLVDSALPPADHKQQRISELQRLKANCRPEELHKLKLRCEIIVRDCIAGLLVNLSIQDFKEVEEELNRAVCWYLTCDRYWEDTPGDTRHFPWGLVFVLVMVLSLGICLCYYIIWVLFEVTDPLVFSTFSSSDDLSVASTSATATATSSPVHQANSTTVRPCYSEEYYTMPDMNDMGQNEHYIYVTYPPELKRRLLE